MAQKTEELHSKRGRGRPRLDGSRRNAHTIRFNDDDEAMLGHLEIESDMNKSDILREALRTYYKIQSRKW